MEYAEEENLLYSLGPNRSWIEISHYKGGAKAWPDGRVQSLANPILKAAMERRIRAAKALASMEPEKIEQECATTFLFIKGSLHELSDYELTKLVDLIKKEQMERETDRISSGAA